MKYSIASILLALTLSVYGQRPLKDIDVFTKAFENIQIASYTPDDSLVTTQPDIKADYWDNTVYSPYKNAVLEFPFQIKFRDSLYHAPIHKDKVVTSRFGWRWGRAHKGIDIDLITGDSVYAILDGIVRMARYTSGHGRTVVIRHFNGLETVYAHLSSYGVKENDTVFKGSYLGKGGNSGRSRGSHLHLGVNYKGIAINPEYLFEFSETNKIRSQELWVTEKWTQAIFHSSKRKSKLELLTTEDEALASLIKQKSIYVVKPGDTLSRISRTNNVSIAAICKLNHIKYNTVIKIGQKLVIEK
ncbi:M23 family metallopeptidase [Seonamhaeicola sp. ML3]|uniref:M23 family metallopeptidase n=1 Tax=Seonamhaeicola sp. ML3 TaxID=2937786 RepID=UPI00200D0344|nr:M23 family metallopeptidase [Seonamhaeicola sp. ML3]